MYSQKYQIVEDALASIGANLENKYDGFIVKDTFNKLGYKTKINTLIV